MNSLAARLSVFVLLFVLMFNNPLGVLEHQSGDTNNTLEPAIVKLREGDDFATLNLQNAWDMSEYADISQALNQSGQAIYLTNIQVQDGAFSARSTGLRDAQFHVLWPGYNTAMLIGKVGHNYPIDAQTYQCLYIGMKVDSRMADNNGPDVFQVFWFANELLNGAGGTWGYTRGIILYPEAGKSTPAHRWKVYKLNLADSSFFGGGTKWTDQEGWQGLRIDPTNQSDVDFRIDWVRLTDCDGVDYEVKWQGGSNVSIFVSPQGTNREVLVASNVTSPYQLDIQGLPPGIYTYYVKEGSAVLSSGKFEINKSPIATFARPSPFSGIDYATQSGNPWDFTSGADLRDTNDIAYSFTGGIMEMETPSGGGVDAIVELNSPQLISSGKTYRYLNFRMNVEGSWQNVPQAMVARWIWRTSKEPDGSGSVCHLVSQDIPMDVGWHIYSIDLSDPFNGYSEETSGDCGGIPRHWLDSSPIFRLRFDPNENILDVPLHQQLDWIRLTRVDSVVKGNPFPVQIGLNKSPGEVSSITFYYTDTLQNPTQHRAVEYSTLTSPELSVEDKRLSSGQQQEARSQVFLPAILRKPVISDLPRVENAVDFVWDTSGVSPGEYYMCVVVGDQFNSATYCSHAPVKVIASN